MTYVFSHAVPLSAFRSLRRPRSTLPGLKPLIASAAIALACGLSIADATEIGATFEKPCPFGDCSAGIAFTYLGEASIETGHSVGDVEFGGISGLYFNQTTGRFIALSDDRAERGPVRIYELEVDVTGKGLRGVSVHRHIPLMDADNKQFKPQAVDPEALRLGAEGIYWASEGGGPAHLPPTVRLNSLDGSHSREFAHLGAFAPTADGSSGIRDNLAFEALTILPSGDVLVALESALEQDGSKPGLLEGSAARMVQFNSRSGQPRAQYVYMISPIPQVDADGGKAMTGLSDMLSLGGGRLLTIERSFAEGVGNTIKIFMVDLLNATDVSDIASLSRRDEVIIPVLKTEVLDLNGIGLVPDNIEAMAIGRGLDGTQILLLAADNNFSTRQKSQFFAFKIAHQGR